MRTVNPSRDRGATAHVTRPLLAELSTTRSSWRASHAPWRHGVWYHVHPNRLPGVIVHGLDRIYCLLAERLFVVGEGFGTQ